jgi:hypothetical protein
LNVFRSDFEDFFEIYTDVGKFALEENDDLVDIVNYDQDDFLMAASEPGSLRFCYAPLPALLRRYG